jgi:peptidoglycan hydrolase-like protein with peptidoglycan-binding domain
MTRIPLYITGLVLAASFALPAFANSAMPMQGACVRIPLNLHVGVQDMAAGGPVSRLQYFLIQNGYLLSGTKGRFDSVTADAVKKFQKAAGLNAQGFVGPQTRTLIDKGTCTLPEGLSFVATNTPTKLAPGKEGVWVLELTLPKATVSDVTYSVDWGDAQQSTKPDVVGASPFAPGAWLVVFKHTYQTNGIYVPAFMMTDSSGKPLRVIAGVTVSNATPTISVGN